MQTSPLARHLVPIQTTADEDVSVLAPHGATHSAVRLNAAETAGYERGRQVTEAAVAERMLALERAFVEARALERQAWIDQEAERLAASIGESLAAVKHDTGAAIARAVIPFVARRLRADAVDEIAASAEDLVNESMPLAIEISGPEDLVAALQKRLEKGSAVVRIVDGDTAELRVKVGSGVLQTRLKEWSELLEEVLR